MTHRHIMDEPDISRQQLIALTQPTVPTPLTSLPVQQQTENDDDEIDLRQLWLVIKRHKGLILLIFMLISLATLLVTLGMTPIYRAGVTLEINTEEQRILNYDVDANGQRMSMGDTKDFYQTQYEVLKSRTLTERVITELGLEQRLRGEELTTAEDSTVGSTLKSITSWWDGETQSQNETEVTSGKPGDRPLSEKFLKNLTVSPVKNSRIVTVYYDDPDPEMAATVANAVADNYISMNLERRTDSTSYARKFLESELVKAKSRLEESESKLVGYAKENAIYNTGAEQPSLVVQKLQALETALTEAEKERITAESEYKQAQAREARSVQDSTIIQQIKESRAKLMAEYQEKLKIYKPDYPLMVQLQSQIDQLQQQIGEETSQEQASVSNALKADYLKAKQKEDGLRKEVEKYRSELHISEEKSIGYNTLQREVETNRNAYESLLQRLKEVTTAGAAETNNVSVLDPALVPYAVHKPNIKLNLALGMVAGLFLGAIAAFLLEFLDDRVKNSDDITRILSVPLLGIAPHPDKRLRNDDYGLLTMNKPTSAVAEAFRSLRTNLMFSTKTGTPKILNVTSTAASEGKSSSAVNIATAFAQAGKQVLLIDADLRKPTVHKRLKRDNTKGFVNYLIGQEKLQDVIQPSGIPDVSVITAGPSTMNPTELLSSEALSDLISFAHSPENPFDIILLDCPPVLGLADALVIGNRTQASILVVAQNQTSKRALQGAFSRLRQAHGHIIGVVMSKAKNDGNESSYYYYYEYGSGKSMKAKTREA